MLEGVEHTHERIKERQTGYLNQFSDHLLSHTIIFVPPLPVSRLLHSLPSNNKTFIRLKDPEKLEFLVPSSIFYKFLVVLMALVPTSLSFFTFVGKLLGISASSERMRNLNINTCCFIRQSVGQ